MLGEIQASLSAHAHAYGLLLSGAAVVLFCYIAYVDSRTFTIQNRALLLLLLLYLLQLAAASRWSTLVSDGLFAALVFALCIVFYSRNALGGGDVKLLPLAFLFVGLRGALPFCVLLLVFIVVHYLAVRLGWARSRLVAGRRLMPYAPSIAGAFLATNLMIAYLAHWAK